MEEKPSKRPPEGIVIAKNMPVFTCENFLVLSFANK